MKSSPRPLKFLLASTFFIAWLLLIVAVVAVWLELYSTIK